MEKFEVKVNPQSRHTEVTDIVFTNGTALTTLPIEELFNTSIEDVAHIIHSNGDIEHDLLNYDQIHVIYSFEFPQQYHAIKENHTSIVD